MNRVDCFAVGAGLGATAMLIAAVAFLAVDGPPMPPLVGYGCEGASGPLYAFEESDFPICQSIEVKP